MGFALLSPTCYLPSLAQIKQQNLGLVVAETFTIYTFDIC